jgi:Asp/Glu/hydantoin racemase
MPTRKSGETTLRRLGLVHTSTSVVPVFAALCAEWLPGVEVFHIADDTLIREVIARGRLTPPTARRVVGHIAAAEDAGADVVLVTCSSVGAAVETATALTSVPVLRVDRPMADRAVALGRRVGVVATLSTTLEPTADLVRRRAAAAGHAVEISARLCEGAFEAFLAGDTERHDASVAAALEKLGREVDVIVLAQASMARVVAQLGEGSLAAPVLASPPLAMEHLAALR